MRRYASSLALSAIPFLAAGAQLAAPLDSTTLAAFRWRSVGPANMSGRVTDLEVDPRNTKVFYFSLGAGGIFKTINNGTTFQPIFDKEAVTAIGDIAIAPSDPNVIYVGTGEQNTRNSISPGGGIYKSTDAGRTWQFMGLKETQHVGRIVVHPSDPNTVYVAALGKVWAPNKERGLYKSTDGGQNWQMVKFVSEKAGFVDVLMHPRDPNTLYAASWEVQRGPHFLQSGGPGSALWKSTDAGATWTRVQGGGWPTNQLGRMNIVISPSNPEVMYANLEADTNANPLRAGQKPDTSKRQKLKSGIYRSADGGKTWTFQWTNQGDARPFYYSQVRVDPREENRIYWMSSVFRFSTDGGKSFRRGALGIHTDWHGMWINPADPEHLIIANDGGIAISHDKGGTYDFVNTFAAGQFYQASFDMAVPYRVCGGLQDNGSWCGPSRTKTGQGARNDDWFNVGGGDGFYTAQDPTNPNVIYYESQGGNIGRLDLATGLARSIRRSPAQLRSRMFEDSAIVARGDTTQPETPDVTRRVSDIRARQRADSLTYTRHNWETPFFLSPHSSTTLYAAGNKVLRSTSRGDSWVMISPDLSTIDSAKIYKSTRNTGGITADNTGAETHATITSVHESPIRPGLLWAGTDDGNVWLSRNDGGTWELLHGTSPSHGRASRLPGAPANGWVRRVVASSHDSATVFVVVSNHQMNDFEPYLWVSNDMGRTFRSLTGNLPRGGVDFLHVLAEDPRNSNLLFVGSDRGVYVSTNKGGSWQKFMTNFPTVPVRDLDIHPRDRELIAATHGRSIWIVDIAPLQDMTDAVVASGAHLFSMKPAFQYAVRNEQMWNGNKIFQAENSPFGAQIAYRVAGVAGASVAEEAGAQGGLGAASPPGGRRAAVDSARIVITDAAGEVLRELRGPAGGGLHRVFWDLRAKPGPLSPVGLRDSVIAARVRQEREDSIARARPAGDSAARGARAGGAGQRGRGGEPEINLRPAGERLGAVAGGPGGGGGGGGFGRGFRQGPWVEPGNYLVTVTVAGRTMKQMVRVERSGEVSSDNPFGGEERER